MLTGSLLLPLSRSNLRDPPVISDGYRDTRLEANCIMNESLTTKPLAFTLRQSAPTLVRLTDVNQDDWLLSRVSHFYTTLSALVTRRTNTSGSGSSCPSSSRLPMLIEL